MKVEKIGLATLYLGDCAEILPALPDFDLLCTDPPYGINVTNTDYIGGGSYMGKKTKFINTIYNWDNETPTPELFDLMLNKSKFQIIFGGNYFFLPPSRCWLIWDKDNNTTDFADAELAWTNFNKSVRLKKWRWNGMLQEVMSKKELREHPTQKPVGIMEWCISHAPKDVVTVCDPFLGSGTTGVAAVKMGKTFIGIEREPYYFNIACRRIEQAQQQIDLFAY